MTTFNVLFRLCFGETSKKVSFDLWPGGQTWPSLKCLLWWHLTHCVIGNLKCKTFGELVLHVCQNVKLECCYCYPRTEQEYSLNSCRTWQGSTCCSKYEHNTRYRNYPWNYWFLRLKCSLCTNMIGSNYWFMCNIWRIYSLDRSRQVASRKVVHRFITCIWCCKQHLIIYMLC